MFAGVLDTSISIELMSLRIFEPNPVQELLSGHESFRAKSGVGGRIKDRPRYQRHVRLNTKLRGDVWAVESEKVRATTCRQQERYQSGLVYFHWELSCP